MSHFKQLKRILFWRTNPDPLASLYLGIFGQQPLPTPSAFVRGDIHYADRKQVADALQLRSTMNPDGGDVFESFYGWSECRICGENLGSRDLFRYGFIWPEKSEHYVMNHNVWHPDCAELLAAIRVYKQRYQRQPR